MAHYPTSRVIGRYRIRPERFKTAAEADAFLRALPPRLGRRSISTCAAIGAWDATTDKWDPYVILEHPGPRSSLLAACAVPPSEEDEA